MKYKCTECKWQGLQKELAGHKDEEYYCPRCWGPVKPGGTMSREIKFRAWDPIKKEMQYTFMLSYNGHVCSGNEWRDDWILMQFTGLHDRNGKEIFEGDIIGPYLVKYGEREQEIEGYDCSWCGFGLKSIIWGNFEGLIQRDASEFKIIGNRFEHPELLTEEETP